MPSIRDLDIAASWEPLHEALQQHVRIPLLHEHLDDWRNTHPKSLGRKYARQGQISATDSRDTVLWYALCYSCMHFDALNDLMNTNEFKQNIFINNSIHSRFLHVDFGCGPGTSTWAAIKNLPDTVRLETIGHDHNPHMVNLAKMMVQAISQSTSQDVVFDFLSDWSEFQNRVIRNINRKDFFLVTANSLFGQRYFSEPHAGDMIDLVKKIRTVAQQASIVICGTHPSYLPETVEHIWHRIAEEIGAETVEVRDRQIESWNPIQCTHDIRDSWYPWDEPGPQIARILVLPPAGGKR